MWLLLWSDGALQIKDLHEQCRKEKWIPIAVYKQAGETHVIAFHHEDVAIRFVKRNFPKDWVRGGIQASDHEIEWIKEKGWKLEIFDWPRYIMGRKDMEVGYEVIEFHTEPDVFEKRVL